MKRKRFCISLLFSLAGFSLWAQSPSDSTKPHSRIVLVPFQGMMYFSDADPDIARYSKKGEKQVREEISNDLDADIYHQLLAAFDVTDLKRATSMNGEEDLKRVYAATRYSLYTLEEKKAYQEQLGITENDEVKNLMKQFTLKGKNQTFWVTDSTVMLGAIQSKEVFEHLHKKYKEKYILYITQFEINTTNKNTIEWTKQEYTRTYTIHYNLFDYNGNIIRAETLTVQGGNENTLKDIRSKDLIVLAQRLKEILVAVDK